MLMLNGYVHFGSEYNEDNYMDTTSELFVNCAGLNCLYSQKKFMTVRPCGRKDYQIILTRAGKLYYMMDGEEHVLPQGQMLLYAPDEPQHYWYIQQDNPEIMWVHFSGFGSQKMLQDLHLDKKRTYNLYDIRAASEIIHSIISELQDHTPGFEIECSALLRRLLVQISRAEESGNQYASWRTVNLALQRRINHHFNEPLDLKAFASHYGVSRCWLIRSFQQQAGMAPYHYLMELRMRRAKELLVTTDNSVQQIAQMTGYENALYFSRLFKKKAGMSPSQFRQMNQRRITRDSSV